MRYLIALIVAMLLIAGGWLFVWLTHRSLDSQVRQTLREQKQAGELPAELQNVEIETVEIRDFVMKVPREMETRLEIANLLTEYWYVWVIVVLAASMAVAAFVG